MLEPLSVEDRFVQFLFEVYEVSSWKKEQESRTQGMAKTCQNVGAQDSTTTIVKMFKTSPCENTTNGKMEFQNPVIQGN